VDSGSSTPVWVEIRWKTPIFVDDLGGIGDELAS
jgi:hypothetical protein